MFRGARRQSVKIGVSKSKRINVAGQGQPKHLNIQPHGQYHAYTLRFLSMVLAMRLNLEMSMLAFVMLWQRSER